LPRQAKNSLDFNPLTIQLQLEAFPDLHSIMAVEAPLEAFHRASKIASQLGWKIFASDAQAGRIEAVDTTRLFGFKDDVVIRIRPHGSGSVIDLRSVSRVGGGDLGANADRIRRFVREFEANG
jgi:uncharacterized protein (DUF1499 family)